MNMKTLVSIAVPTKNRYYYLKSLILLVDSFATNELELVIQDNSDDNKEILNFLGNNKFPFISYFYSTEQLTMTENCNLAIQNCKGEYVCFIGDDDCVTRNFLPCVKWMVKNEVRCVFPRRIMYFWPDYCDKGDERSAVHFEPFYNEVKFYDTQDVLNELLDSGCIGISNMPLIYHGIVKRDVLTKIKEHCGSYLIGASPDIAGGVSLCMIIDKYASFSFPIVIAGNSRPGGGGVRVMKHHAQTDFSKLPFLPKNTEKIWCPKIPKIWSNPTIWCESVVEALNVWKREDLVNRINFEKLYINFVVNYFYYRKMAFELTNNKLQLFITSLLHSIILFVKNAGKFILKRMHLHLPKTRIWVFGIKDSTELCSYFENKGYIFEEYFKE